MEVRAQCAGRTWRPISPRPCALTRAAAGNVWRPHCGPRALSRRCDPNVANACSDWNRAGSDILSLLVADGAIFAGLDSGTMWKCVLRRLPSAALQHGYMAPRASAAAMLHSVLQAPIAAAATHASGHDHNRAHAPCPCPFRNLQVPARCQKCVRRFQQTGFKDWVKLGFKDGQGRSSAGAAARRRLGDLRRLQSRHSEVLRQRCEQLRRCGEI